MVLLKNMPFPVSFEETEIILYQMKKCICCVSNGNSKGTGFFCKIPYKGKKLNVMITCYHCLSKDYLMQNNQILLKLDHDICRIDINDDRKIYSNKEYDISIIEINPSKDKIYDFLEIDENIFEIKEYYYYYKDIYILQYCKINTGFKKYVSYGKMRNFDEEKNMWIYLCSTGNGASGSPILNIENNKLLGIHKEGSTKSDFNYGIHLKNSIIDFNNGNNLLKKYKDNDFSNLKLISSGSYGDVYSAFSIKDEIEVCLKKINLEKMKLNYEQNELKDYQQDLNNEIDLLELLSYNNNSVKYYGNYNNENEKIIIMEKCDKNLYDFIKQRKKSLTIDEIKQKFQGLNELFKIIQREKIIHRDLKLENFLIKYNKEKTDYIIKLGDYGTGKFKGKSNGIFSGLKGTIDTVAPEIILEKTQKYESSVDMFSLGIILFQLSNYLVHPFGKNYIEFIAKYKDNYENDNLNIKFDKSITNNDFKDLITKMTRLNPKNRLSWEDYFNHPFFKKK